MINNYKKVLVLGFARSGYSVSKLLLNDGVEVVINDMSDKHDKKNIAELEKLGAKFILGSHPDDLVDDSFDLIIKNPGIPPNHKYEVIAEDLGILVSTEIDIAYTLIKDAHIIAVTGSNGKTTTASIIYEILKNNNKDVYLAGNIGFPLSDYVSKKRDSTIYVVEISAQQLSLCKFFKANTTVFTNLVDAHLDYFCNSERYQACKLSIFDRMTFDDLAIINADDTLLVEKTFSIKAKKLFFSLNNRANGASVSEKEIYLKDEQFLNIDKLKLRGKHNHQNIMAALLAVDEFSLDDDKTIEAIQNFSGVEHRIEFVRSINNIEIFNDSKSTNIEATKTALLAFNSTIVLMLGGLERGQDFRELVDYMNFVKEVISFGECGERVQEIMEEYKINCTFVADFTLAIQEAYSRCRPYDTLLLSPASASWDVFKNFEERGNIFKIIINQM